MPYIYKHLAGDEMRDWLKLMAPFVPKFTEAELAAAHSLVVHCSSASDPGPDWSEFHLFNEHSETIAVRRQAGY